VVSPPLAGRRLRPARLSRTVSDGASARCLWRACLPAYANGRAPKLHRLAELVERRKRHTCRHVDQCARRGQPNVYLGFPGCPGLIPGVQHQGRVRLQALPSVRPGIGAARHGGRGDLLSTLYGSYRSKSRPPMLRRGETPCARWTSSPATSSLQATATPDVLLQIVRAQAASRFSGMLVELR